MAKSKQKPAQTQIPGTERKTIDELEEVTNEHQEAVTQRQEGKRRVRASDKQIKELIAKHADELPRDKSDQPFYVTDGPDGKPLRYTLVQKQELKVEEEKTKDTSNVVPINPPTGPIG